ncbi:zinc ribbon domain-containing protein [Nocardioides pocheonensis]|uniref:zinc ribbon domain-containing protein n=1 Tax=Nocardioides pocheonensis TaxID=661485 RepID=UPI001FE48EDD|nr:C4-type zinc ribbon domain-containing protein [Nocardioides pocheonensis]
MKLLDVQELDSRLDALNHQLSTIPEAAALAELTTRRAELDGEVRDLRVEVDDLTSEQKRADADVEQVKARRVRDQGMIDAGSISDPKALQRMLGELESLQRRISDLEDVEIDVMERLEGAQAALDQRTAELAKIDRDIEALGHTRAHKAGELDEQLASVAAERKTTASGIPADLLALYEKLRLQKGGVGAAALRRRECSGCRLTLNPSDLATIAAAPTDEVIRCEECSRILVRTGESGL